MSDQEVQERPFGGFGDSSNYDGPLQDGSFYPAVLLGVKERYIEAGQYPGWKVIWGFRLTLPDGTTELLEAMSSAATGPDSKAGEWLVALVGQERFNQRAASAIKSELEGARCQVYVKFSEKGWPRVGGVFPAQNTAQAPTPPTPPQATPTAPAPQRRPTQQDENYDDLPF